MSSLTHHNIILSVAFCFYKCGVFPLIYSVAILYQFVEMGYVIQENISSFQVAVELAPSSGILLEDVTLYVSSAGGSATGMLLIELCGFVTLCFSDDGLVYWHILAL